MSDHLTITGLVATPPRHIVTSEGLPITSFRLASTQRRFDRGQDKWIDGETNWYTITAFRQLAIHAAGSIEKGQRVVLSGRLRIRDWENGERTGTTIDIEADALEECDPDADSLEASHARSDGHRRGEPHVLGATGQGHEHHLRHG